MDSKQQPPISPEHLLKQLSLPRVYQRICFKTSGTGIPAKSQQICIHNLIYLNSEWKLSALQVYPSRLRIVCLSDRMKFPCVSNNRVLLASNHASQLRPNPKIREGGVISMKVRRFGNRGKMRLRKRKPRQITVD